MENALQHLRVVQPLRPRRSGVAVGLPLLLGRARVDAARRSRPAGDATPLGALAVVGPLNARIRGNEGLLTDLERAQTLQDPAHDEAQIDVPARAREAR